MARWNPASSDVDKKGRILAYGPLDRPEWTLDRLAAADGSKARDDEPAPHSWSVPHPSSVHWSSSLGRNPPWATKRRRPLLASYIGTASHGIYGIQVRQRLTKVCKLPWCKLVNPTKKLTRCYFSYKKASKFCLEPAGDNPYRKSVWDSLSCGCIPVVFNHYMRLGSPWHWGPFRNESMVYINSLDFIAGKIDLRKVLRSISQTEVRRMA